jgi:hypothetical protein
MSYEPDTPESIIKEQESKRSKRSTLDSHLQEVADYSMPTKNDILRIQTEGAKRNTQLFDSTAEQSTELLANALNGMLTNPATEFFEGTTGDDKLDQDDEVRAWLQDWARKIHFVLNASNFQTEVHEYYLDQVWAGTAAMTAEEDDQEVVRFKTHHISQYDIEENERGIVDRTWRNWKWPLRNIVAMYGLNVLTPSLQKLYKDDPSREFDIVQKISPRDPVMMKKKNGIYAFPIQSITVLKEDKIKLKESGFREMPMIVARWMTASGETYGRSCAMKVLPDVKMINEMMKTTLEGAQMTVFPAYQAPDDGFIMPLIIAPKKINYYRSGSNDRIEAIGNDSRIDWSSTLLGDTRQRIREGFYIDQFQSPASGSPMTAKEWSGRIEEKLKIMGPILARQGTEFLPKLITRVSGIMGRRKMFKPMPQKLLGRGIAPRYSSQIAIAQRASAGTAWLNAVQALAPIVGVDPTVVDILNGDVAARSILKSYGLPQDFIRNQDEIDKMREARAKAKQAQADAENQAREADVASKMGAASAAVAQGRALERQGVA